MTERSGGTKPAGPRLPRVAKGRRPRYFDDPAVEKLTAIIVSLAGEVSVLRDRLDVIERLLEERSGPSRADIDAWQGDSTARRERDAARGAFLERVFQILQYEREAAAWGEVRPIEDIIADFDKREI